MKEEKAESFLIAIMTNKSQGKLGKGSSSWSKGKGEMEGEEIGTGASESLLRQTKSRGGVWQEGRAWRTLVSNQCVLKQERRAFSEQWACCQVCAYKERL